ncbi:MAG: hypothetical protein B0A82_26520 [Alkalinema sp. CACIAM 70d]|nr:MAG: hypothetical protein B0A82_26520 [Alkalinema sp. CACIAM 70d]
MSNALAIGAVTAVIKNLLENGLIRQGIPSILGGMPTITVLSPDPEGGGATNGQTVDRLNLFLYQTNPNPSWRNVGLPSRNSSGDRISNPPLALDLHYLITAYTKDAFHAEILLGHAMQLLHEMPVLSRDVIRSALRNLASSSEPAARALATSDLAEQLEQIKLSAQPMSTEEVSKLWSAIQTQYRPTVVYQASIVLIESQKSTKSALPVRERRLHIVPFEQPVIAAVKPQIATPGSQLTLEGRNFRSQQVTVNFGAVAIAPDRLNDQEVQVTVPSNLSAGINTLQIQQLLDFGPDSGLHQGFESNLMPFVLAPKILQIAASEGIRSGNVTVTVQVIPIVRKNQQVTLFLNQQGGSTGYSANLPPRDADSNQLSFTFPNVKAGQYLARLRVDGAASPLEIDDNPNSSTFNQYIQPSVNLTCINDCLRVIDLNLNANRDQDVLTVVATVRILTEMGVESSGTLVSGVWTLPDGSQLTDNAITSTNGVDRGLARFETIGTPGTYTFTVTNLSKTGFTFDAPQSSVLTRNVSG